MAKKLASQKTVDKARQAYKDLVLAQNHLRAHRRATIALPPKKIRRYSLKAAKINISVYNAGQKWEKLIMELSPQQIVDLNRELVR